MATHALSALGLDPQASDIYLACLSLGKAKASDIAKKAKLTRTAVYRYLDHLSERGLLHHEIIAGKRIYAPANPQIIPQLLKQQEQEATALLPSLIQLFAASNPSSPKFRFYNEASGIKIVLEEVLECIDKSYRVLGSIHDDEFLLSVSEAYMVDWTKRRIARGVQHQSLRPRTTNRQNVDPSLQKSGPEVLREIRYTPQNIQLPILIYLFDQKVAFVNGRLGRQFAAILESKDVYDALGSFYDFIWEQSEKSV